ncbi:helix-turn-helix domain-containing protein [Roseivivax sp. GX 12232]|uniref:helix-turn-helix domain-containing protein n=1 Tax=Roseivivax sp. GX 12232 TaxID=2900547 RepID=UPI001E385828|nr:helix-turn-helix domain-containing protein [Roseivivax sp. GX 12232]MCE0506122.1 helix-turn-helix domain-containing protein [Roseivivax sp. GX 12232]
MPQEDAPPVTAHEGRIEPSLSPDSGFLIERHRPRRFREPYHHHASIEVNYLDGVSMTYAFSGEEVTLPERRLTLFWAIAPHRVTEVAGRGTITNIYLPLGHMLQSGPGGAFLDALFRGAVLSARPGASEDGAWLDRLLREQGQSDPRWRRLHLAEIDARLARFALEGWEVLRAPAPGSRQEDRSARALGQVERMLHHISEHFAGDLSVSDVTGCTDLSPSHAGALFRRVTQRSIKQHIDRTRLSHAWVLLSETDLKISSVAMDAGYRSLSSFYEAVTRHYGMSPGAVRKAARQGRI